MQSYDTTQEERTLAMLSYLVAFFAPVIGPLIIYLLKNDQSRFVGFHALQSILLDLETVAVVIVALLVCGVLMTMTGSAALFLFMLTVLTLGLGNLIYTIVAAVRSYSGEWYPIPGVGVFLRGRIGM